MDDFEWIKDIPIYIDLKPRTLYYFEPNLTKGELEEFVNRINIKYHKSKIFEFLTNAYCDELGIKYFTTTDNMGLDGWCNETTIEEAKEYHPCHTDINGRTL